MHLLEYLQLKTGCEFMSDLHLPENFPLIRKIVKEISPKDYPITEWKDAINYITREKAQFSDVQQAADYLKNYQVTNKSLRKGGG